jgi:hypothetical protein
MRDLVLANGKVASTYFTHIAREYDNLPPTNFFIKAKTIGPEEKTLYPLPFTLNPKP